MRVALISDIHGNLVALNAALADIGRFDVDRIICLGDVASTGPQPLKTLGRLRGLDCPVVVGNADAWLLDPRPDAPDDEESRKILDIGLWCARQLGAEDLSFLRSFKPTVDLDLGEEAALLCFHGSPHSNTDIILATTPEGDLDQMLSGYHALVLAGGHTHVPLVRRHRDALLLNPGSVGLPFERDPRGKVRNPPWAEYAIVEQEGGDLTVRLRRVPYDLEKLVETILGGGMPHAEWFAGEWG